MCNKATYLDRKEAKRYANRYRKEGKNRQKPYRCPTCNHWHLSATGRKGTIKIDRSNNQRRLTQIRKEHQ